MKDIKLLCQERGLKLKDVAEAVGMTSQNLGVAMRGNPTLSLLRRVAKALGITMQEFFSDERWVDNIEDSCIVQRTTILKNEGIAFVQLKLSLGDYEGDVVGRRDYLKGNLDRVVKCVETSIGSLNSYGEYEIDVRICEKR